MCTLLFMQDAYNGGGGGGVQNMIFCVRTKWITPKLQLDYRYCSNSGE